MSWKIQSIAIFKLIKEISDECGGDEEGWLNEYSKEVIKDYAKDLAVAVKAFTDIRDKICHKSILKL